METIFMNMENSKTNEPHKFLLNLSQLLVLRSSKKHAAFKNLSIYYSWKSIRQQYQNNKFEIIQRGMMSLNYLVVLIRCQLFKIISNT